MYKYICKFIRLTDLVYGEKQDILLSYYFSKNCFQINIYLFDNYNSGHLPSVHVARVNAFFCYFACFFVFFSILSDSRIAIAHVFNNEFFN